MTETARPFAPAPGGTLSRKTRDALFRIHLTFGPKASTDLAARLGLPIKIEARSVEVVIGATPQIAGAIAMPFLISPGAGSGFMGLESAAARVFLEASLGGTAQPAGSSTRERSAGDITPVERRVAEGFMEFFLSRLNALWESLGECAFTSRKTGSFEEGSPEKRAEETYVIVLFSLSAMGTSSALEVGLPLSFVKPLTAGLEHPEEKDTSMVDDPKLHPVLKRKMDGVTVPVRAFLAEPDISLRDMAALEPGDVLNVGRLGAEAVLLAGSVPMFRGQAGILNGHRAIRITSIAKQDRRSQ
ncbi:MAG: FliM/FliN family flagellar motor switch protein [Elusimicrobia bacterium]|jgi:flagellar motor switch protein FliM|nr:FliM/FliN family flagellar motor switch protein [Elusimicrobiota bacterium]